MTNKCLGIVEWLQDWFTTTEDLVDAIYPIGSIYMSVNSTSPSTLFGGTWQKIEDKFLLASGTNYTTGDTGGEATHTLTESELPYIDGTFPHIAHGQNKITGHTVREYSGTVSYEGQASTTQNNQRYKFSFGSGQAHNNMPPYLVVNIWKRTA